MNECSFTFRVFWREKWRLEAFANEFQNIKKKPASECPPPENKENDSPDSQKGHHMFFRHEIHLKYMRTITNHDNPTLTHTSNAPNIDRGF